MYGAEVHPGVMQGTSGRNRHGTGSNSKLVTWVDILPRVFMRHACRTRLVAYYKCLPPISTRHTFNQAG